MSRIRALALDLDGTLIGPDERISSSVAEAVQRAAGRLHVSIVTGRESESILNYARELGLTSPQVADNGALVIDPTTGDAMWSAPMSAELAMIAMQPIIESGCQFMATHAAGIVTDMDKLDTRDLTRVTAFDLTQEEADEMIQGMSAHDGLDGVKAYLPYNGLWAVNFTRSGVNKGTGLRALCGLLGIRPSQVAAVGDSFNDVAMFEVAGLSIAMGGAPAEVLASAHHHVSGVEQDGLVEAIERYVLPRADLDGVR